MNKDTEAHAWALGAMSGLEPPHPRTQSGVAPSTA